MKRGTPRHPKVAHLADLLKVKIPTAVGYLELLWHFTAEFAPQGDIGRFADTRIEAGLYWPGPAGKLVAGLIEAGFVDRHATVRLVVHHWHDHADGAVIKRLQRQNLPFLSVAEKVTGQQPPPADNGVLPVPEPEPEPSPSPSQSHAGPSLAAPERARDFSPDQDSAAKHGQDQPRSESSSKFVDDDETQSPPKTPSNTDGFAKPKPLDHSKPSAYATPADQLKAIVLEKTGKSMEQEVLDEVSSNLGGAVTQEFVDEVKPHFENNLTNPVGFIRKRARKRSRPASAPETVKYKCTRCGSPTPGVGLLWDGVKAIPCKCASAEYIAEQVAKGEIDASWARVPPPAHAVATPPPCSSASTGSKGMRQARDVLPQIALAAKASG